MEQKALYMAIQTVLKQERLYFAQPDGTWNRDTANAYLGWCMARNQPQSICRLQPTSLEFLEPELRARVEAELGNPEYVAQDPVTLPPADTPPVAPVVVVTEGDSTSVPGTASEDDTDTGADGGDTDESTSETETTEDNSGTGEQIDEPQTNMQPRHNKQHRRN